MRPLQVLEIAEPANFDESAYLRANPDVLHAGRPAREHFEAHGIKEGRRQLTAAFVSGAYRKEKFNRFRHVLDLPVSVLQSGTFPIVTTERAYDLADYLAESANAEFGPFTEELEKKPDGLFLDIGCGFRERLFHNCLYLEVYPSVTADLIVEPNCTYPIKSGTLDGIGCFSVLEHTRKPWIVVAEIARMLKPAGFVFIDWPFLQPVHGFPSHYYNATREGLRTIFEDNGFAIDLVKTGGHETPAHTVNWIATEMLNRLPEEARERLGGKTFAELAAMSPDDPFWRGIVGALSDDAVSQFACGNMLIGRKA